MLAYVRTVYTYSLLLFYTLLRCSCLYRKKKNARHDVTTTLDWSTAAKATKAERTPRVIIHAWLTSSSKAICRKLASLANEIRNRFAKETLMQLDHYYKFYAVGRIASADVAWLCGFRSYTHTPQQRIFVTSNCGGVDSGVQFGRIEAPYRLPRRSGSRCWAVST